jgi:hypothetical protein
MANDEMLLSIRRKTINGLWSGFWVMATYGIASAIPQLGVPSINLYHVFLLGAFGGIIEKIQP